MGMRYVSYIDNHNFGTDERKPKSPSYLILALLELYFVLTSNCFFVVVCIYRSTHFMMVLLLPRGYHIMDIFWQEPSRILLLDMLP